MTEKQLILVAHSCAGLEVALHLLEHGATKEKVVREAVVRQLKIAANNLSDALGLIAPPPVMAPEIGFDMSNINKVLKGST